MTKKENPITILQQKYDAQEITDIVEITLQEMNTIGFVTFYFKVKHIIKPYLFWSSFVPLLWIMFGNADLWTFFIPAFPVALLLILFAIDFVKIQFGLLRAQKRLQKFLQQLQHASRCNNGLHRFNRDARCVVTPLGTTSP